MRLIYILVIFIFGCKQPAKTVVERYPSGIVMTECFYSDRDDTSSFTYKVYYENGKLKHLLQVASNMYIGEKKSFFENGSVQRIEKLNQPTPLHAEIYDCYILNFRPNGTKESEYQYVNDRLNGLTIDYDSTGNKSRTAQYVDGKMNGKETLYFSDGKIKSIAFVENDTLKGLQIDFKENGDTLKWFHNGEYGLAGVFYKKWLDNGLILTGNHGDSLKSFVVWNWLDSTNSIMKRKVVRSAKGKYAAPE